LWIRFKRSRIPAFILVPMSRPIIEVENVSKRYKLGQFNARTLRDEVEQFFRRLRRKNKAVGVPHALAESSEFWALKDVSFSVQRGEVVGIIGRNGAGKSTLLKILSRVTEPTSGEIRIRGRVASLLEVGTGFHPELTGRENIYLNGTILGMTKAEVRAKFDEIVAFAETEKFLDTPVKRYSSGMHVRLAFAVAAHLEPEILIVDEVLAVGDAAFQKKCIGKMRDLGVHTDRTVLIVSHNMAAIAALCPRTVLLSNGRIVSVGPTQRVVEAYLANSAPRASEKRYQSGKGDGQSTDLRAELMAVRILNHEGRPSHHLEIERGGAVEITYQINDPQLRVTPIVHLSTLDGQKVLASIMAEEVHPQGAGLKRAFLHIPGNMLNNLTYQVGVCIATLSPECTHCEDLDAICFEVLDSPFASTRSSYRGVIPGLVRPNLEWSIQE
jgi:lipopolysaccharide transport system ATP-binding protein